MSDVGDSILFVCGGGAKHIVGDDDLGVETASIDLGDMDSVVLKSEGHHLDESAAFAMMFDKRDEIMNIISGKRVVMAFVMLGGGTGAGSLPVLSECAHDTGCEFVSVIGIPFEAGRREPALESLREIMGFSDRMFLFDTISLTKLYPELTVHRSLNIMASTIHFTIRNLVNLIEGPFFSTFTRKIYTAAYTASLYPSDAVAKASEASFFKFDPSFGRSVVMVSSNFGTAELESIRDTVAGKTGIIPDIVRREDAEDTKVLTFLPVQDL